MASDLQQFWSEAVRYGGVSIVAFSLDVSTLFLLVEFAGLHYLAAATCSFIAGAGLAYFMSTRWYFSTGG